MKKVAIHNLGCKVNSYEAESMEQMLKENGYEIVPFDENSKADIYIINTCSVTNIADRKSRQMLHKAKKMNENAIIIAAGCYVNADTKKVSEDVAVDIVLGNNNKKNVVEAIEQYCKDNNKNIMVTDMSKENNYEELKIQEVNEHTRAYIKIQDGCNQFCSYCIIPYTRGRIRSRNIEDIKNEVSLLVAKGYKEFVLTGIHLSSYGMDNNQGSLLEVIESINSINGVHRIRLGSLEPRIITDEFAMALSNMKTVCPHFHLSLQSGCDTTLKRMNRKYTTEEYYEKCCILRKYFKNPAITTDVIVGFPQETQEDFEITRKFLEKVQFYEMHIFKYSRRKGTVADKMEGQIDEKIKNTRSSILLELEKDMSQKYRECFLNTQMDILVEEVVEIENKYYCSGYTANYIKVLVPFAECESVMSQDIKNNKDIYVNKIFTVQLYKNAENNMIFGKMINTK